MLVRQSKAFEREQEVSRSRKEQVSRDWGNVWLEFMEERRVADKPGEKGRGLNWELLSHVKDFVPF